MTFGHKRQSEESRSGGRGKPYANFSVAIGGKAPFQRGARIAKIGEVGRSRLLLILDSFEEHSVIFGMSLCELPRSLAFHQFSESINPYGFKQSVVRQGPAEIRGDQRLSDQVFHAISEFGRGT